MKKLPFKTRLIMWKDYLKYVIFLQQGESLRLIIEIFIFILSINLLQYELFQKHDKGAQEGTVSIIVVFVILKFILEIYVTQKQVRSYFNIQHSLLRNPSISIDLLPSEKEQSEGFSVAITLSNRQDLVFVSSAINRHIQTTHLKISLSEKKPQQVYNYLQKHKEILLQYLNYFFFSSLKHGREFTNNQKFCLSSDITLNTQTVGCHIGGYYDSFLTNQIVGTTLVLKDKKHTTLSTEHIFPSQVDGANKKYLSDISSTSMNNHIGCSTLGFTTNREFIIWTQAESNQFNNGLLVPTGSGSCNADDITHNHFQQTIMHAMERELKEETLKTKEEHHYKTMILGFYRWVSRGGKPEFVGITKLPENSEAYSPNALEVRTKKTFKMDSIDDLPATVDAIRQAGELSLPLYMCLSELEYMYKHHHKELKTFLFDENS